MRKAVFGQDKPQLEALCAEQLSYGHSDGRVETKAQFINGVMTRKAIVKSITLSDHTIAIVGINAIARHTWVSESETDGKLTSTAFRKFVTSYFGLCSPEMVAVGQTCLCRMAKLTYHGLTKRCTSTKIGVLQVWQKQGGDWKLLARQSVRPPQAQAS